MTFEEFFIKKKIDLIQMERAEPALFSEFKSHFELMGEKSFDHTKKFWFNKLRRTYHLKEEPKIRKEIIEETAIASQADPLRSPTIDQKPAAGVSSAPLYPDTESKQPVSAFKPRFKPRNIAVKDNGAATEEHIKQHETSETPVYGSGSDSEDVKSEKEPRTEKETNIEGGQSGSPTEEQKPVYKPRFNLKNIKSQKEPEPAPNNEASSEQKEPKSTAAAYRPKFNLRNIKSKEEQGIDVQATTPEKEQKSGISSGPDEPGNKNMPETALSENEQEADHGQKSVQEDPGKKTGPAYKPRFNMKNIKSKPAE